MEALGFSPDLSIPPTLHVNLHWSSKNPSTFLEPNPPAIVESGMAGFLALGGLFLAGFAFLSLILAFVVMAVKAVFWLVFLPFRLLFWGLGAAAMLVGTGIAIVVGLALILAPLLPLAIVAAMVYGLVRIMRRPAMA